MKIWICGKGRFSWLVMRDSPNKGNRAKGEWAGSQGGTVSSTPVPASMEEQASLTTAVLLIRGSFETLYPSLFHPHSKYWWLLGKERKLVVLFVSQGFESSWSAKLLVWARGNTTHHEGGMWPAKLLIFWPSCKGEGRGCNPVKGLHAVTSLLIGFTQ